MQHRHEFEVNLLLSAHCSPYFHSQGFLGEGHWSPRGSCSKIYNSLTRSWFSEISPLLEESTYRFPIGDMSYVSDFWLIMVIHKESQAPHRLGPLCIFLKPDLWVIKDLILNLMVIIYQPSFHQILLLYLITIYLIPNPASQLVNVGF